MILIRLETGEVMVFPLTIELDEMARFTRGKTFKMVVREGVN